MDGLGDFLQSSLNDALPLLSRNHFDRIRSVASFRLPACGERSRWQKTRRKAGQSDGGDESFLRCYDVRQSAKNKRRRGDNADAGARFTAVDFF